MRHYRIRTPNGWYTIDDERDMTAIGEIYKDRLVGEADIYGHLIAPYFSPDALAMLDEVASSIDWEEILKSKSYKTT